LKLLFAFFHYYYTIILNFSYYTHYSQNKNGVAGEYLLRKSASKSPSFPEAAQKQEIIILLEHKQEIILNHLPQPPFPAQWRPVAASSGWAASWYVALMYLRNFKPTIAQGLTKLRAKPINLLCDGGTLVLPYVICKAQVDMDQK
jgi:hypothetical protein